MHLGMVLEMASENLAERVAISSVDGSVTFHELGQRARRAGAWLSAAPGGRVVLVDENSLAVSVALFGSAIAGKPYVPVNYRLADDRLRAVVARTAPCTLIAGDGVAARIEGIDGVHVVSREEFLDHTGDEAADQLDGWSCDVDACAVLLFTSGTTGEPKAAMLRNRNLAAYLVGSVEFAGAGEDEATIVSVPPYHIAAVSSALSTAWAGRRVVLLEAFEPQGWVDLVRTERVTHAMVVPTMLNRILDVVEQDGRGLPSLRSLAYGGGPMPRPVVERALALLADVDLVNAYGLTETASTVAVLGPDEHRAAFASDDPTIRARLGSVGKPLPSVEVSVRDPLGTALPVGEIGEIWVRGEQVAGEYDGTGSMLDDGWFNTRDSGHVDAEGYLYVHGRLDDVIVRGGENLSPGEIEAVLLKHPAVAEAAVVGLPDVEWGERVVAAVVTASGTEVSEDELQDHVRRHLRSARTPQRISFVDELPFSETGKLLRRVLREQLADDCSPA